MAATLKNVGYCWMLGNVCSKVQYLAETLFKTEENLFFERSRVQKHVYHSSCARNCAAEVWGVQMESDRPCAPFVR